MDRGRDAPSAFYASAGIGSVADGTIGAATFPGSSHGSCSGFAPGLGSDSGIPYNLLHLQGAGVAGLGSNASDSTPSRRGQGRRHEDLQQKYKRSANQAPADVTTLMLRNVPRRYTEEALINDLEGFVRKEEYNFLYLPWDNRRSSNCGYAFINCVDARVAARLVVELTGRPWGQAQSAKEMKAVPAHVQGIALNLAHYMGSSVVKEGYEHSPMVLVNGFRIDFKKALEMYCPPELIEQQKNAGACDTYHALLSNTSMSQCTSHEASWAGVQDLIAMGGEELAIGLLGSQGPPGLTPAKGGAAALHASAPGLSGSRSQLLPPANISMQAPGLVDTRNPLACLGADAASGPRFPQSWQHSLGDVHLQQAVEQPRQHQHDPPPHLRSFPGAAFPSQQLRRPTQPQPDAGAHFGRQQQRQQEHLCRPMQTQPDTGAPLGQEQYHMLRLQEQQMQQHQRRQQQQELASQKHVQQFEMPNVTLQDLRVGDAALLEPDPLQAIGTKEVLQTEGYSRAWGMLNSQLAALQMAGLAPDRPVT